ncbi:MAG: Abi family protein [Campylobacterota bacterium]|nr:Abi family protein [Campylobacterota bacterium]
MINFLQEFFFDLTSRIESKIKSILIDECYKRTKNHFFYLVKNNHKWDDYKIDFPTINNWKIHNKVMNQSETYSHYILFYLQNYSFNSNQQRYLVGSQLIDIDTNTYNYPPFKYLIESATLGSVISFIQSLKLGTTHINKKLSEHFGLGKNFDIFYHYLQRLNEVRNRTAHGGRIFNRTFRSVTGLGKYQTFRTDINNHKSMDIYLFLFNMLNQLDRYDSMSDFINDHSKRLFRTFKKDCITNRESNNLLKKYSRKDFKNIEKIIYYKMIR